MQGTCRAQRIERAEEADGIQRVQRVGEIGVVAAPGFGAGGSGCRALQARLLFLATASPLGAPALGPPPLRSFVCHWESPRWPGDARPWSFTDGRSPCPSRCGLVIAIH